MENRRDLTGPERADSRLPHPEAEIDAYGFCRVCRSWLPWKMLELKDGGAECRSRMKCRERAAVAALNDHDRRNSK